MTLKEMYANHQELWFWLADNPKKEKKDWPGWDTYDPVADDCFACQWTIDNTKDTDSSCPNCPLDWPHRRCGSGVGLFFLWCGATDPQNRAVVANLIANVPLKTGLKEQP